jgi:sulfur carrier protein
VTGRELRGEGRIEIVVNGEAREVPAGSTVARVLEILAAPSDGVAVELGGRIVRRAERASTVVRAGDRLEVVTFVGGG